MRHVIPNKSLNICFIHFPLLFCSVVLVRPYKKTNLVNAERERDRIIFCIGTCTLHLYAATVGFLEFSLSHTFNNNNNNNNKKQSNLC